MHSLPSVGLSFTGGGSMSPRRKKVLTSSRREAVEVTQLFETMECQPSERWFISTSFSAQ